MDLVEKSEGRKPLSGPRVSIHGVFEGGEDIAAARELARAFLTPWQTVRGAAVSHEVMGTVQLVVSELVTNARKYAPGPCLLTLEVTDRAVEITVRDRSTTLPTVMAPDPARIGRHGLEIVMGVCHRFEVHREPAGKRITAFIALRDGRGGRRRHEMRDHTSRAMRYHPST